MGSHLCLCVTCVGHRSVTIWSFLSIIKRLLLSPTHLSLILKHSSLVSWQCKQLFSPFPLNDLHPVFSSDKNAYRSSLLKSRCSIDQMFSLLVFKWIELKTSLLHSLHLSRARCVLRAIKLRNHFMRSTFWQGQWKCVGRHDASNKMLWMWWCLKIGRKRERRDEENDEEGGQSRRGKEAVKYQELVCLVEWGCQNNGERWHFDKITLKCVKMTLVKYDWNVWIGSNCLRTVEMRRAKWMLVFSSFQNEKGFFGFVWTNSIPQPSLIEIIK